MEELAAAVAESNRSTVPLQDKQALAMADQGLRVSYANSRSVSKVATQRASAQHGSHVETQTQQPSDGDENSIF